MKLIHEPRIDLRYWIAITLASIFGTNMGDFYAHNSGLGILAGLSLLAVLAGFAFVAERIENIPHALWYWLVIVIIRTGATNLADWLAYGAHIPALALVSGLAALIAAFAWLGTQGRSTAQDMPLTNAAYWIAMLAAGVFGTVLGDIFEHTIGEGVAAIGTLTALVLTLGFMGQRAARFISAYWIMIAIARTTGTAIGDWMAEDTTLHIGLPLSTLISGIAFAAVVLLWKSSPKTASVLTQP